jgi:signal transduction histidine kinase
MLRLMVEGVAATVGNDAGPPAVERVRRVTASPWRGTGVEFRVWSDGGEVAASVTAQEDGTFGPPLDVPARYRPALGAENLFDVGERKTYRVIWARRDTGAGPVEIVLAHPSSYEQRRLNEVALSLALSTAIVVLVGSIAAGLGLRRVFAPVEELARDALSPPESRAPTMALARLPRELEPLLDAARRATAAADAALERQRRFSADAAHELRTPLAVIKSTLELAGAPGREAQRCRAGIAEALEDVRRMERLIEGLFLLAQIEDAAAQLPDRRRLRLDELLCRVIDRAREGGAAIEGLALATAEVEGSETLLERLFANVVENAIKYGASAGTIRVELALGAGTCEASVEDGAGAVPPHVLERLFDRFYRAPGASDSEQPGTGLGLAIALAIARRHGGDIAVQVVPGRRTRVAVRLPLAP